MGNIRGNLGREGKLGIIPTLESANLHSQNYFIPSTYRAGTRILEKANLALSNYFIPSTLLNGGICLANYFIESSYKDGSGKTNKCYLVTKMDFELLGNKQQGEKGKKEIEYMKKYREKQKMLSVGKDNSKVNSKVNSKANVNSLEEEKEKEEDKNKNNKKKKKVNLIFC